MSRAPIAAATAKQMVVNYPNLSQLNPNRNATRADVAAFIYQALVSEGQAPRIQSSYIVSSIGDRPIDEEPIEETAVVPAGTKIPVSYEKRKKFFGGKMKVSTLR
ncbi:hypothetical protein HC931_28215 [Candidatus Gracilibacteria bacterium]|nr:hypothetical protein [Candidatus Gracilibacteria bacterium]